MLSYVYIPGSVDSWFDIAKELRNSGKASPSIWIGHEQLDTRAKSEFGDVVISVNDFRNGQVPVNLLKISGCASSLDLGSQDYLELKDRALKMLDRDSLWFAKTRNSREAFFHFVYAFFCRLVDEKKPDFLIAYELPHMFERYILFHVCKATGIPCFVFGFFGGLLIPALRVDSFNSRARFENFLKDFPDFRHEISIIMEREKERALGDSVETPQYLSTCIYAFSSLDSAVFLWAKDLIKQSQSPYQVCRQLVAHFPRFLSKYFSLQKLFKHYQGLTTAVDRDARFVYVALHYEPEATTNPTGGNFHDQLYALGKVRNFVPDEVSVVVKEHPSIFRLDLEGDKGRSCEFYDFINAIPNVYIADIDLKVEELIDSSEMVFTISGSAGYEAALRSKPVVYFGDVWYSGIQNAYMWSEELTYECVADLEVDTGENVWMSICEIVERRAFPGINAVSQTRVMEPRYGNLNSLGKLQDKAFKLVFSKILEEVGSCKEGLKEERV